MNKRIGNEKVMIFTKINIHAPRTKECMKQVFGVMAKQQPLWVGKEVEVVVSESSPVFPEVIQLEGEAAEAEYKKSWDADYPHPNIGTLDIPIPNFKQVSPDDQSRQFTKMELALSYITNELKGLCELKNELTAIEGISHFTAVFKIVNYRKLLQRAKKLKVNFLEPTEGLSQRNRKKKGSAIEIYYNIKTGKGFVGSKKFTFKNHTKEFSVFANLYRKIGDPILREKILKLSNYPIREDGYYDPFKLSGKRDQRDTTATTYFINELVKNMRTTTGLNTHQLTNNNGDITLVAKKLRNSP